MGRAGSAYRNLKAVGVYVMQVKFIDLEKLHEPIMPEIAQAIDSVVSDNAFIGGKYVEEFEQAFGKYHESKCISCNSGTDALILALKALGIDEDSRVIVPDNTFIATANAVSALGGVPIFAETNDEYLITAEGIKEAYYSEVDAIIVVHLYGNPCDMDSIIDVANEYNLPIIEDCAQAHGATYKGKKVGTFGACGCFSFYPTKNLGAMGDGGAVITGNAQHERFMRILKNNGRMDKYEYLAEGINSRLDGIQAAVLTEKLKHLDELNYLRRKNAGIYYDELKDIDEIKIITQYREEKMCVYHQYVIEAGSRNDLQSYLALFGIETGIYYPCALTGTKPYYKQELNEAENFNILSLPMHPMLTEEEIIYVCDKIKEFYDV